jgi:hypothetical protein
MRTGCCPLLAAFVVLALALPVRAQVVATCDGAADGTPCPDGGDNCTFDDGFDHCIAGSCQSPPPCLRTQFEVRRAKIAMQWQRDRTKKLTGDYCVGQGFVSAEEATRLLGVPIPGDERGLVPVMNERRRKVPRSGRVRISLSPSRFGKTVLGTATKSGAPLPVLGRMTLVPGAPGGKILSANRVLVPSVRK